MTEQEEKEILLNNNIQRNFMDRQICLNCGGDASEYISDAVTKNYEKTGLCHECQNG